ncbi:tetratricopeptide repeat protein [Streptomyces sp. B21-102]|uniref:tetratricopeptide repeat protein n=1 Tax=unclassified Streptomyces TaxID=2593676 RepID=UPI002FF0761F
MEFDRRVQIRTSMPGEDDRRFGSGYLIAPRLVLTAAHVVGALDPGSGGVSVSRPDAGEREYPATVCWQRRDDQVDAALVEVDDGHGWQAPESLSDLFTRPPQRWGHLIGTRSHPVALVGFPRMQKDADDGRRLDEQLTGHITPGTGTLVGRYEISGTGPTVPVDLPTGSGGSRWSGMSGAAVLSDTPFGGGDLLCGVTRRDRQATGGTRLTATPAALLLADHGFRTLVTEHSGWEPALEPAEAAHLLAPAASERDLHSPAALLRADTEAVAFHGRTHELADLRRWCESGPAALSVRVVTGPGGQGKTRLARHLTHILSQEGWVTGHLRSDLTDHDSAADFTPLATALPLLLVVDYAETRPRLLRRLVTHLHSRHPVRLLLLARSDGEWRTDALNATPGTRRLLKAAPVTELAPLLPPSGPAQDRITAFTDTTRDLARLLSRVPSLPAYGWEALAATLQPADDLSDPRYDNVLTLQLAALVALLQHGPTPVITTPDVLAEEILLEHEERFWEDSARAPAFKLDLDTITLAGAVAVAVLCGATSKDEAIRATSGVPGLSADETSRVARWLAALYPAEPDRYWGSLQPDRIAEYHASQTVTHDGVSLSALLSVAAHGQQAQIIIVLARAAIAHYNAGRTSDSERLLNALETALETTGLEYEAVRTATDALSHRSHILAPLHLGLTTGLVQVLQPLAVENPAAYEPALAGSLSNLGGRLSEVGLHTEGLNATNQAVDIWRRLAEEDPAAYEPDLATALGNLGTQLGEVSRRAEALTATEQAVEVWRRLAAENPDAHESDFARSLSNLGARLSAVGRDTESLTPIEQAVTIHRRLAMENPAAHEPELARSLANLALHLSNVGRHMEALRAAEQAVTIYRRLAMENPAAHEPELARSLTNLGGPLGAIGREADALSAEQESLEIRRRLAAENPAAHGPGLATSLFNLGIWLLGVGRDVEGIGAQQEAVEVWRRLAADNPATHEPELANALGNLGIWLSVVGRPTEALTATEQAVEVWRRLAAENPDAHDPGLATSLSNLSARLSAVGRGTESLTPIERAVTIYRRLATENPAAYDPDFATALDNLGDRLSKVERRREALSTVQEAVVIRRRLAADDPAANELNLARSLSVVAVLLAIGNDLGRALYTTGEAVELYRNRLAVTPSVLSQLHAVLNLQAQLLDDVGRQHDAQAVRRWLRENPLPPDSHN